MKVATLGTYVLLNRLKTRHPTMPDGSRTAAK